jgi:hypothetical protein
MQQERLAVFFVHISGSGFVSSCEPLWMIHLFLMVALSIPLCNFKENFNGDTILTCWMGTNNRLRLVML